MVIVYLTEGNNFFLLLVKPLRTLFGLMKEVTGSLVALYEAATRNGSILGGEISTQRNSSPL